MPVLKSSKKRARQTEVRRERNVARKSSVKTAVKKVLKALEAGNNVEELSVLLRDAESKISRAEGKGLFHARTAARKVSYLARKVSAAKRTEQAQ